MTRTLVFATIALCLVGAPGDEGSLVSRDAHAVVGRPLTPVSYAGVARRTARRTTRRTAYATAGITTLPAGCAFAGGIYTCGAVRYRPYYSGTTVVYQVVQ